MKAQEYKKVKAEAENYIKAGRPIGAAHVMEQHEARMSQKQYYEFVDMIHRALEG